MVKGSGDIFPVYIRKQCLAITPCVMIQAVLAIPEMECERVLVCMDRMPKTNRGIAARLRQKFLETYFINNKFFAYLLYTIILGLDGRKEPLLKTEY